MCHPVVRATFENHNFLFGTGIHWSYERGSQQKIRFGTVYRFVTGMCTDFNVA